MSLWLLLFAWLSPAWAGSGLAIGETHLAAWGDAGVRLYDLDDLEEPISFFPIEGEVRQAVAWQGAFIAIVDTIGSPVAWRFVPGERLAARLVDLSWPYSMAVDPHTDELILVATDGGTSRIAALEAIDGGWLTHIKQAPAGPRLGVRTQELLYNPPRGVIGVSEIGLHVALRAADGEVRVAQGTGIDPVDGAAWVGDERLVSIGEQDGVWRATRWSLLHPWIAPWPFAMGSYPLDATPTDVVAIPDGAWILADAPLRALSELPGVVFGLPDGLPLPIAGALWTGRPGSGAKGSRAEGAPKVLLLYPDLSLALVDPPKVPLRTDSPTGASVRLAMGEWSEWARTLGAPDAETAAVARGLAQDDLPLGVRGTPGGSIPKWISSTIIELIRMSTPLNQVPLLQARAYLSDFDDPSGELRGAIEAREIELRGRTVTFWGGLLVAGSLAIWLWRWASRRIVLRDQVLASAYNPFRQDSPNNPSRTPFAANSLADDLLRTLDLNCVVVEGPQFSGKSALLRHVSWRLQTEGLRGQPARMVHMSLFGVPEEQFWTELGRGIAAVYPGSEASEEVLELTELDRGAVEYLLDEVLIDGAPRLVLVLDDLDALGLYESEAQRFRGLLQVVPSHRMAVLGAGQSIRRGFAGDADESPWFNLFQVRQLRPMSHEELVRYLDSRLRAPFSFSSEAAARLHELTEGRPLQVWHLCFAAVEHLLVNRRFELSTHDVDTASDELRTLAGVFVQPAALHADAMHPGDDPDDTITMPPGGAGPDAVWDNVVRQVAEARRRRAALLVRLAERQQRETDDVMDRFFVDEL